MEEAEHAVRGYNRTTGEQSVRFGDRNRHPFQAEGGASAKVLREEEHRVVEELKGSERENSRSGKERQGLPCSPREEGAPLTIHTHTHTFNENFLNNTIYLCKKDLDE